MLAMCTHEHIEPSRTLGLALPHPSAHSGPVLSDLGCADTGMALFTQAAPMSSPQSPWVNKVRPLGQNMHFGAAWHRGVITVAREHHWGALSTQGYLACGVCGACHDELSAAAARHTRTNGVAHALDILVTNVDLMTSVANVTGVSERVHVHHLAGSNETRPVKMWVGGSYKTNIQAGRESNALCESDPECMQGNHSLSERALPVRGVSLDDFYSERGFAPGEVFLVSIDAEGVDPLILEGMRRTLEARAVAIVHFEKHQKGYWAPSHPEHRTLGGVVGSLHALGYECFVEGMHVLVPVSGGCWRPALDNISWSNLVCAHDDKILSALRTLQMRDPLDLVHDFVQHRGGLYNAMHASIVRPVPEATCWLEKYNATLTNAAQILKHAKSKDGMEKLIAPILPFA